VYGGTVEECVQVVIFQWEGLGSILGPSV